MITSTTFINDEVCMYLDDILEKNIPKNSGIKVERSFRQEMMAKYWQGFLKFKSFLKKDNNNNYYVIDRKFTVKCVFNLNKIDSCLNKQSALLLYKNIKNLIIDIRFAKVDIKLTKASEKLIHSNIIIVIDDFSLEQSVSTPYKKLNYKHKDINLDNDVDNKLKTLLSYMKKENLKGINDNNNIGKSWLFSGISMNDIIELSDIKIDQKGAIEFIEKKGKKKEEYEQKKITEENSDENNKKNLSPLKGDLEINKNLEVLKQKRKRNIKDKEKGEK